MTNLKKKNYQIIPFRDENKIHFISQNFKGQLKFNINFFDILLKCGRPVGP